MKKLSLLQMVCLVLLLCGAIAIPSPAQILTTLHAFDGPDGLEPYAGLIQATDGNFYGTTSYGGPSARSSFGTIFKITLSGTLTTLHVFDYTDGEAPNAGLIQATDGNFYGTTSEGGVGGYAGTVFKITPSGTLTTLYRFCSQTNCTDGQLPDAGLIQATDGNFYGTTYAGGAPAGWARSSKSHPAEH